MSEFLPDIIFWHEYRFANLHICGYQQIAVILKKYVAVIFKDSRFERFCKIFHINTLIQTVHHGYAEILEDITAVIAEIFKLRKNIIKCVDLFLFVGNKQFILIYRPHNTHHVVFFIYTIKQHILIFLKIR